MIKRTDEIYYMKFRKGNWSFHEYCYDANEVASLVSGYMDWNTNTFSYVRVPAENHIPLETLCGKDEFELFVKRLHYDELKGTDTKVYFSHVWIRAEKWEDNFRHVEYFTTMEEALADAINAFDSQLRKFSGRKEDLTDEEKQQIIEEHFLDYKIAVEVVSKHRIRFDYAEEIRRYYVENVFDVPKGEMYDFLLTLINHDERNYDFRGEFLNSRDKHQLLGDTDYGYIELPLFSMENAERLRKELHEDE